MNWPIKRKVENAAATERPDTWVMSDARRTTGATGSSEAHRKIRSDKGFAASLCMQPHHHASAIWREESVGYGTNYVTISGDCVQCFLFRRAS
jgi:hypothetical protein